MHNRKRPPSYEFGCARPIFHWARCHLPQARSQFKSRSTANNVSILVPVPSDADSPKFKTTTGSTKWIPEKNVVQWNIKSFPVSVNAISPSPWFSSVLSDFIMPPGTQKLWPDYVFRLSILCLWQKASFGFKDELSRFLSSNIKVTLTY